MKVNIEMHGAAREVGRSGILVQTGNTRFLLDYGVKLQEPRTVYPLPVQGYLDFVVLSHAHLDHSGALPLLYQAGEPRLCMPNATSELIDILLRDFLKISKMKKNEAWNEHNFKRMKRNLVELGYGEKKKFSGIELEFFDAGHILGAGMTKLDLGGTTLVYSGDYKDEKTRLHNPADLNDVGEADIVIVETTYGNRDHPDRDKLEKEFVERVKAKLESGGNVILPAFAVGRAQEVVEILHSAGIDFPVYLDGMAQDVAEVYLEYPELLRNYDELYNALKDTNWIADERERRHVLDGPSIVVTTAGMLNGGPVLYYLLDAHLRKSDLGIYPTGFQVPGTPGRRLLEDRRIALNGHDFDFSHADIVYFDFSAHCDRRGIHSLLKKTNPDFVILNHGDEESVNAVYEWAQDNLGADVFAPKLGERIDIKVGG